MPLCGGKLFMSNHASSVATARPRPGGGVVGTIETILSQQTLAAEGACLSLVSKDHIDSQSGVIQYIPVPAGSTCRSLPASAWPDPAPPAQ